jgi:hypothetical protein
MTPERKGVKFSFTKHAADVVAEREISLAWVARAINRPDLVETDRHDAHLEHRLRRIRERQNRVLRVILNIKARPWRVVTVYFDRAMRGKL